LNLIEQFKNKVTIYPVTCSELSLGRSNEQVLREIIKGGAGVIQHREKKLSKKDFYKEAIVLREIAKQNNVLFIVNDYVDVAIAVDADGVHLGQDDLPCKVARQLFGKDKIIGVSTHNMEEALKAEADGASYINIGPVFKTLTKQNKYEPLGIETVEKIKNKINIPFTVMGGINMNNMKELITIGAKRIAVVSAIVSAKDISLAVREFKTGIDI
jgi:thiamine-phosphate pyrophosphorylase